MNEQIMPFYHKARDFIIKAGYLWEIEAVENRYFKGMDTINFLDAYIFCVFNVGMKNQIAQKMYDKFYDSGCDINTIGHPNKKKAIGEALDKSGRWFAGLLNCNTDMERVEYLDTLPMIGEITKFHLARNLGMDVAKPDRHLVRLMEKFEFKDVQEMCTYISRRTGDRVGVVDVVLWRNANLNGSKRRRLNQRALTIGIFI